ncbi:Cyclic AMP-dependent transcription factor ATF-5 [Holothuria leucospilota]|uniref:Cyclic AMP-dependent transcription factor ATF-5 n=1 Tax=Holothuria leucospilota TaxID=206669 RepID=A0A9Q1C1Y0_HOLLE|nr:Cyclic AMP-dependent transcription factor ATF-5 [Holothuria leucospilota]
MHYDQSMMASMESPTLSSSLLDEDLSIWSFNLPKNEFGDGASLDSTIQLMDSLVSSKQEEISLKIEGDHRDPLPGWMSEKIDISSWLNVLEDESTSTQNELKMDTIPLGDELISTFVPDDTKIPVFFTTEHDLDVEPLEPLSPGSSMGSNGTAVNSNIGSPMPSSPSSLYSEGSSFESFRETDEDMDKVNAQSLEFLINSCSDANTFLQLGGSLELAIPKEEDIKLLQEDVMRLQGDLTAKVKSESKTGKVKPKPKAVSKERKERKKGQNKEAATRYRQKKKKEAESLSSELEGLEKKNGELKDKVGSLEQEISYLKTLLQEIYKVKGQIKVLKS